MCSVRRVGRTEERVTALILSRQRQHRPEGELCFRELKMATIAFVSVCTPGIVTSLFLFCLN